MDHSNKLTVAVSKRLCGVLQLLFCQSCCSDWQLGCYSRYFVDLENHVASMAAWPNTAGPEGSVGCDRFYLDIAACLAKLPTGAVSKLHYSHPDEKFELCWNEVFGQIAMSLQIVLYLRPAKDSDFLPGGENEMFSDVGTQVVVDMLLLAGRRATPAVVGSWTPQEILQALAWARKSILADNVQGYDPPSREPDRLRPLPRIT